MKTLKDYRREKGLTQKEVTKNLCISESCVSLYENNKRKPRLEDIKKLARLYKVTTDKIIDAIVE